MLRGHASQLGAISGAVLPMLAKSSPSDWAFVTARVTARAIGEFGAVSVISGHISGLTNTMPLHVEILYNEYNFVAAFAVAKNGTPRPSE